MSEWNFPSPTPTPPAPKKSHTTAIVISVIIGVLLFFCIVGTVFALANKDHTGDTPLPTKPAVVATDDSTAPPAKTTASLTKDDVELTLTTTSSQCFGDVACSVEVKVTATVDQTKLGDNSWDITYTIKGDTSGPIVGTLTINPDLSYTPGEEALTTRSKNTKVTVAVTRVEKVGF